MWNLFVMMFFINDASIVAFTMPRDVGVGGAEDPHERKRIMPNEVGNDVDVDGHADLNPITASLIPAIEFVPEEDEMSRYSDITNIFHNFLPALGSNQGERSNAPPISNSNNVENILLEEQADMSTFLDRLLQNIIIDRNSLFRVQFFNSDFQRNASADSNDTSILPNAIFGSPLCFGLCFTGQVYSENGSIRVLSDKRLSLFPPGESLGPSPINRMTNFQQGESYVISATDENPSSSATTTTTTSDYGVLGWVPDWIYNNRISSFSIPTFPSIPTIPLQQYIPQGIIRVPSFIG